MNLKGIQFFWVIILLAGGLCLDAHAQKGLVGKYVRQDVLKPYTGPSVKGVDTTTLNGKVVCGYQGWFNCMGDGAGLGWTHWARNRKNLFGPGNVTVDLWPDLSEFDEDELYETGFRYKDGRVAKTFTSHNRKSVIRHFKWMKDYGIDGAFVQRFTGSMMRNEQSKHHKNVVLSSAREGANLHGRCYIVMYDISGTDETKLLDIISKDWRELTRKMEITRDPAYLHHNGKPLVAVWGVGFNEKVKKRASLEVCEKIIEHLKREGCSVMLGNPTGWLPQNKDAIDHPRLHEVFKKADVISPWTAGRYKSIEGAKKHAKLYWQPDVRWCKRNNMAYLPVVHPGFSWANNKGGPFGSVPRLKGKYMWAQVLEVKKAGAEMVYVGMFDEVDEGTAIFKCSNNPPTGNGTEFLTYDGLSTDYYLKLTGNIGKLLRGEIGLNFDMDAFIEENTVDPTETESLPVVAENPGPIQSTVCTPLSFGRVTPDISPGDGRFESNQNGSSDVWRLNGSDSSKFLYMKVDDSFAQGLDNKIMIDVQFYANIPGALGVEYVHKDGQRQFWAEYDVPAAEGRWGSVRFKIDGIGLEGKLSGNDFRIYRRNKSKEYTTLDIRKVTLSNK